MLRQVLTLFAILTGLAATGAPAQASVPGVESVSLIAAAERTAKCTGQSSSAVLSSRPESGEAARRPCPRPKPVVILPPIMLRADRALE